MRYRKRCRFSIYLPFALCRAARAQTSQVFFIQTSLPEFSLRVKESSFPAKPLQAPARAELTAEPASTAKESQFVREILFRAHRAANVYTVKIHETTPAFSRLYFRINGAARYTATTPRRISQNLNYRWSALGVEKSP